MIDLAEWWRQREGNRKWLALGCGLMGEAYISTNRMGCPLVQRLTHAIKLIEVASCERSSPRINMTS